MHHLRGTMILLFGTGLCLAVMLSPAASAARDRGFRSSMSAPKTVRFTYKAPPLLNSVQKTLRGDKASDGSCIWHPGELTLPPGVRAVEERQISADNANCTTVVEIGTPAQIDSIAPDEKLATGAQTDDSAKRLTWSSVDSLYNTSQGYYKVTWYDVVGLTLNYVRSILNWTWGQNQCILGSVASSATFSQVGSGWGRDYWNWWKTTSCTDHRTHTDADFSNYLFCIPPTHVYYRNVRFRGGYQGGYGGALDSTWSTGACLPLHWSAQLVKEY